MVYDMEVFHLSSMDPSVVLLNLLCFGLCLNISQWTGSGDGLVTSEQNARVWPVSTEMCSLSVSSHGPCLYLVVTGPALRYDDVSQVFLFVYEGCPSRLRLLPVCWCNKLTH